MPAPTRESEESWHLPRDSRVERRGTILPPARGALTRARGLGRIGLRTERQSMKGQLLVTLRLRHQILGTAVATALLAPALVGAAPDAKKGAAEFKGAGC